MWKNLRGWQANAQLQSPWWALKAVKMLTEDFLNLAAMGI